jgi:S1-C subfamily serine protease
MAIDAIDTGAGERPYLGCSIRSQMDKPGMMVLLVNTDSPAWHANMKVGDILLEVNGV